MQITKYLQSVEIQRIAAYLGRNSVIIERFGGRVTAPINRTTFGCLTLLMIRTLQVTKINLRVSDN